jgi:hypothetical protein
VRPRRVVVGYAIRHRGGLVLFDTGSGSGMPSLTRYTDSARRVPDAWPRRACHRRRRRRSSTATSMSTTPARTRVSRHPDLRPAAEWEVAHTTDHTILEWIDFAGSRLPAVAAIRAGAMASASSRRPATRRPPVLAVRHRAGLVVLGLAKPVYTAGEWAGDSAPGRGSSARPGLAALASIGPTRSECLESRGSVAFGKRPRMGRRTLRLGARPCYPSEPC